MRVVFLTHNYPRYPGDLPGAFLHPLAQALRDRGVQVRVVAPSDAGQGGRDTVEGIPVHRVRYAAPARERLAYTGRMADAIRSPAGLRTLFQLGRALRAGARAEAATGDLTVIHAHWWMPAGWAAPPELPLVVTLHGTDGALLRRSALVRMVARRVLRRAERVTVVSSRLAAAVSRTARGVEAAVQPMPVDARDWPWSRGGGGILIVCRLAAQKRVRLALEVAALLARGGQPIPMTIVGEGSQRAALEADVRLLAIETVVSLTGALPTAQVRTLLERADLALQLGREEGLGLAAAEALMSGVPVIACEDGGGLLDLVPRTGPGRIAPARPEAIADAVRELLSDPEARGQARDAGMRLRERLRPDQVAARFHDWYRDAAKHVVDP